MYKRQSTWYTWRHHASGRTLTLMHVCRVMWPVRDCWAYRVVSKLQRCRQAVCILLVAGSTVYWYTHCCSASVTDYFDACSRCRMLPPAWSQAPVDVTTSHQCYGSCIGCQSISAFCLRLRGWYISRLPEPLPCTLLTTAVFCRTLVVAHCGPTPMTRGSCSCHERITNLVIHTRPPVPDYGTTFYLDYGGCDLPSTALESLSKLICLATEVLSDFFEYIGAI